MAPAQKPYRIAILGLNYAPEPIGIGPYTTGLAEWLASQGHDVSVVAGRPYYPKWAPFEGYPTGWNTEEQNGVRVTRCPHYIPKKPSGSRRILHHASFALGSLLPMFRETSARPEIVLAIAPSLLSVPIALFCARACGAKLWVHIQDFEIEAALAAGLLDADSLGFRLGRAFERSMLTRSDLVTTISPQMCSRLVAKGVKKDRVEELRNWANHIDAIRTADPATLRKEWNLGDKFVALYSGNVANKQGLEVVIEAARLLENRTEIAFVICGEGPNRAVLEQRAKGLVNIRFENLQPEESFGPLMRLADCHLLPQLADAADLVLPSKLANMLASGRPVIATAEEGTGLANEVEGCGIVVQPEDPGDLADAIAALADDRARADALGKAAAVRAEQRWSKHSVLSSLDSALAKLVDGD